MTDLTDIDDDFQSEKLISNRENWPLNSEL